MSATSKVAGAVAAGYLLGRFKKLRLALLVGTAMASPKFRSAAVGLIENRVPGGAMVGTLGKEVGTRLLDVGKTAATSVVAARIDGFSESLAHRSENLRKSTNGQTSKSRSEDAKDKEPAEKPEDEAHEGEEGDEPEDEYDQEDSDVAEEPRDEYEEEEEGDEAEEPEDEYDQEDSDAAEEPRDEYEDEDSDVAEEPQEEYEEEDSDEAQEAEDEDAPVARSSRRRRSASPAGRRRG